MLFYNRHDDVIFIKVFRRTSSLQCYEGHIEVASGKCVFGMPTM